MEWVFDGIGTQIIITAITLLIGASGGGIIGYKVGVNKKLGIQKQKAQNGANQEQRSIIGSISGDLHSVEQINESGLIQKQKAGNNSIQKQTGEIHHE